MKFSTRYLSTLYILSISIIFSSCKSGSVNLFKAATPHEQYQRKLAATGLDKTAMGSLWLNSATISLEKALNISIPFKEVGYFSAEKATATAYKFKVIKGQKLTIALSKKPLNGAAIYLDVWQVNASNTKLVASADTLNSNILLDIDESGSFLIRLQPELLQSVEYNLEIISGPSQGFPTRTGLNNIKSFFGDGRDANSRKHEGVDIFGNFRSPVVATSDGTIVRVNENNLGGKVLWFRPKNKDYTLYYAHLDEQLVSAGQDVLVGDTLGLMGNTGNAKTTPPHLHFGLYTSGGAIDPLPFINPIVKKPVNITASISNLNKTLRTNQNTFLHSSPANNAEKIRTLQSGTILIAHAASANWYKTELPDGSIGFIQSNSLNQTEKPLQRIKLKPFQTVIYDKPDSLALVKLTLNEAQNVRVLGNFGNYHLISDDKEQVGWIKK
ncbi:M23 family metallopeptidase [Pedobacter aquatilis]|uniref:M23 family metallopeptidase n=1 Tax=Pedobacter aquatilis TaxID=351343 RepID=UPI0025B57619|nr:M23 family metallopeptidase [Pedobacter aquatilis]MDN3587104.1 M23 family metallopeptidase [Pedobacter aquatilis]